MVGPSLQDGIDKAGSPVRLLWKPNPHHLEVPAVPAEYIGWAEEQAAWQSGVVLFDLCHHMPTLFVEGPEAKRLLKEVCANDLDKFEVGQAKQAIAVTRRGDLINDGILMRMEPDRYHLNAVPPINTWIMYHAQRSGYDVQCRHLPAAGDRPADVPPIFYRYQIQGPRAMEVVERLLGGPPPVIKFFHSTYVTIAGRKVRAFRHGMTGLPGFEFSGPWEDNDIIKAAILEAGEASGIVQVGGMAYYTNGLETGWIPLIVPGIYSDPELADYREFVPLYSFEGQRSLHGSFFSENIEDYYVSPWDIGYGRLAKFDRAFIGREALEAAKETSQRTRVTLVLNKDDVRAVLGDAPGYVRRDAQDRVEIGGEMIGLALYTVNMPVYGTLLSLALIDKRHAAPGTEVSLVWGEHPGPGTPADAHREFPRIRATVEASPFTAFAREEYRR